MQIISYQYDQEPRALLAAARRRVRRVHPGVRVRKSEPQTTGLITAKTVTIAWRIWWRFVISVQLHSPWISSADSTLNRAASPPRLRARRRQERRAASIARRGLNLFRMAESVLPAAGWPSGVRIQAESDFVPCTWPTSRANVATAACELDLAEYGGRIGPVGAKPCFVGEHNLARLVRRHGSQIATPALLRTQRRGPPRQPLNRTAADAARHA